MYSRNKIGITQRVERCAETGEVRDCLDQRWTALLENLRLTLVPLANRVADPAAYLEALGLRGLILSGGNDLMTAPGARSTASERDRFEQAAFSWALDSGKPVLGVCRGMQAINVFLGGHIEPAIGHAATRHMVHTAQDTNPFSWPNAFEVNSFHDFAIPPAALAPRLVALAHSGEGLIEAFRHESAACVGIMWHPERENPFAERDLELLRSLMLGA